MWQVRLRKGRPLQTQEVPDLQRKRRFRQKIDRDSAQSSDPARRILRRAVFLSARAIRRPISIGIHDLPYRPLRFILCVTQIGLLEET